MLIHYFLTVLHLNGYKNTLLLGAKTEHSFNSLMQGDTLLLII